MRRIERIEAAAAAVDRGRGSVSTDDVLKLLAVVKAAQRVGHQDDCNPYYGGCGCLIKSEAIVQEALLPLLEEGG